MSCTGGCCVAFPLPSIEELRADPGRFENGAQILEMIIPLTHRQAVARSHKLGSPIKTVHAGQSYFACKNWDEETRLCTIYDDRPVMCSAFPYGGECEHGCGCKDERICQVAGKN